MAENKPQSLANHTRLDPLFHFFIIPVFFGTLCASAIVGDERIPGRLRRLLNVESGVNDGLALPAVVLLIAHLRTTPEDPVRLLLEVLGGIALGIGLPWLAARIERLTFFRASPNYEPLFGVAIGLLLFFFRSGWIGRREDGNEST